MPTTHIQSGSASLGTQLAAWWQRTLGRPLANALLAQSCALCQLPSGDTAVCPGCAGDLPALSAASNHRCPRCALPLHNGLTHCPDCARHSPSFDAAHAVWAYGFPIDTLIRDFKYGHHLYLGRFFAEQLTRVLQMNWTATGQTPPDLIVPMPLHPNRLRSRGFNQAAEIARQVGRQLGIPCSFDALIRVHDTPPQAGLHRDARWQNLHGAFGCPKPLSAPHVLLIDDVLTTGASLSACTDALRHAGAERVEVAVIARTPEPFSSHHA